MAVRKPAKPKTKRSPRKSAPKRKPNLVDRIIAIGKTIPPDELDRWPVDGAANCDEYLDGSRKFP